MQGNTMERVNSWRIEIVVIVISRQLSLLGMKNVSASSAEANAKTQISLALYHSGNYLKYVGDRKRREERGERCLWSVEERGERREERDQRDDGLGRRRRD